MANDQIPLFSFYDRYLWGPADFDQLQTAMVDLIRGPWGAAVAASVVTGGAITPNGANASVHVAAFVAVGDDGYMHVKTSQSTVALAAGDATHDRYDLIVCRAAPTVNATIARPVTPHDTVTFTTLQETQLVVIKGTPGASPAVPAKVAGDVIMGMVRVPQNWVNTVSSGDIELVPSVEIGQLVRFDNSAKGITIAPRFGNTTAIKGIGSDSGYGLHGVGSSFGSPAIFGEGAGGGVGGRFTGADAIDCEDPIFLSMATPASGTGFTNRITPGNVLKARAWVTFNVTTPVIQEGFNITNPRYSGNNLLIDFVDDFAGASFDINITKWDSGGAMRNGIPSVTQMFAGSVSIELWNANANSAINIGAIGSANAGFFIHVYGAQ